MRDGDGEREREREQWVATSCVYDDMIAIGFSDSEKSKFQAYGNLDYIGRCMVAISNHMSMSPAKL